MNSIPHPVCHKTTYVRTYVCTYVRTNVVDPMSAWLIFSVTCDCFCIPGAFRRGGGVGLRTYVRTYTYVITNVRTYALQAISAIPSHAWIDPERATHIQGYVRTYVVTYIHACVRGCVCVCVCTSKDLTSRAQASFPERGPKAVSFQQHRRHALLCLQRACSPWSQRELCGHEAALHNPHSCG